MSPWAKGKTLAAEEVAALAADAELDAAHAVKKAAAKAAAEKAEEEAKKAEKEAGDRYRSDGATGATDNDDDEVRVGRHCSPHNDP